MKHIGILVVSGLLAAQSAFAGVYVETVDNNLSTGSSRLKQKMYVQNGAGRFVDNEGRVTIIKDGAMFVIDEADKSYVALDKATMEQLAKKLNAAMAQAKEQLAKLPPDQRAQMEQMMGGALDGEGQKWTVEVADTGKTDKVDGRTCKVLNFTRNGQLDEQVCVVPYSALPGKEDFQKVFADFAKVFEEMAKSVPMLAGKMENEFSAQVKANGFPVRRRAYENGSLINEESVVKVWREENVPASMFEIPAGYKPKQMSMGPGM
jgi:hypothetical protein